MDPSMDLSTTTEPPTFNPAQILNHAPTPTTQPLPPTHPTPSFSTTHPDYAEMITAAITALKEKEGSSRIAISKYIDRVYTNLPPNHSALLTHHLKRLKNSGYLALVKHSYILAVPGSAPPPPPPSDAVDSNGSDVSSPTKRKPGRPPKMKPEAQQVQPQPEAQFQDQFQAQLQAQQQQQEAQFQVQPQFHTQPQFIQQQPQYLQQPQQYLQQPQFQAQIHFQPDPLLQNQLQFQPQQNPQEYPAPETQNYANIGAESVFVSLGLADGPVGVQNPAVSVPPPPEGSTTKRRPGRPRKDGSTVVKPTVESKSPGQSGAKRRPGRPPKSGGTVNASPGSGSGAKPRGRPRKGSAPGRRGRPRKNPVVATNIPAGDPNATSVAAGGDPSGAAPTPKRRGRPPRASNQGAATVGVTDVPIAAAFDSDEFNNTVGGVTNGAMQPLGKRRGRPPKSYSSPAAVSTTVKRQRKLSGKPLGRPKKNVTSPAVSDPKLVVAYEELKGKLEHMQSRIREAASALKPCLNAETPATALAAMQELEELAAPAGVNPMQQI